MRQIKDFKSNDFVSAAMIGLMGAFFGCAASKGLSGELRKLVMLWPVGGGSCGCCADRRILNTEDTEAMETERRDRRLVFLDRPGVRVRVRCFSEAV